MRPTECFKCASHKLEMNKKGQIICENCGVIHETIERKKKGRAFFQRS